MNDRLFVTVHETANASVGADAMAHAKLQSRGNVRQASWHYQVDDAVAVQSFPHTVRCWHAGDGRGPGNLSSIAIEICVNADGDFPQAVDNAAELVARLMAEEGIPLANVVQHNRWSGKACPTFLRAGSKGLAWADFLAKCSGHAPAPAPAPAPSPTGGLAVDGSWGPATTRALQRRFGTPVDGVVSHQWKDASNQAVPAFQFDRTKTGSQVARALQVWLGGLSVDGLVGARTVTALQARMGTPVDAVISFDSLCVREVQARLNAGTL